MGIESVTITWPGIERAAQALTDRWRNCAGVESVYGIPRGGVPPALLAARMLDKPIVDMPSRSTLIVDDLIDHGATMGRFAEFPYRDALYRKSHSPEVTTAHIPPLTVDGWLVFPWEVGTEEHGPASSVVRMLEWLGEDPRRDGLLDTPARVLRSMRELTAGYRANVDELLSVTFDGDGHDEMIVCDGITFTSVCEHHMLPFSGVASVGYVPNDGRIVGLSKLARLVDAYAQRLQVQERMTDQIARALEGALAPQGVGVVVRATHACMAHRGVRKASARMVTSSMLGLFRDDGAARAEFLRLSPAATTGATTG